MPDATRVRRKPRTVKTEGIIEVEVLVRAKIVKGEVTEEEFLAWVQHAVDSYHRFRNGWVGLGAHGSVHVPEVTQIDG